MASTVLTEKLILEITGQTDPADVTELEIIFTNVHVLGGLDRCVQLHTIRLINTSLRRISRLDCVCRSLQTLTLTDQRITKIENLNLPHLRELLLHRNSIERIEGLDRCPRLERLWLCSNKIKKIENLQELGGLRELWLQDNQLREVTGLDYLVSLECLALGQNQIADFKDISRLAHLPALYDLSLADPSFGDCPIVRAEGYRNFVVCHLKSLRRLDGVSVKKDERSVAEDDYMQHILKFNRRIDDVCQRGEREMLAIEAERKRKCAQTATLQKQLLDEFRSLEDVVAAGETRLNTELERQQHIRTANREALEASLRRLQEAHAGESKRLMADERRRMAAEKAMHTRVKQRADVEMREALLLAALAEGGSMLAQLMLVHTPAWDALVQRVDEATGPEPTIKAVKSIPAMAEAAAATDAAARTHSAHRVRLRVMRAYHLHHSAARERFWDAQQRLLPRAVGSGSMRHAAYLRSNAAGQGPTSRVVTAFFYATGSVGVAEVHEILRCGFAGREGNGPEARGDDGDDGSGDRLQSNAGLVLLYTNPTDAVAGKEPPADGFYRLLECSVAIHGPTHTHFGSCLGSRAVNLSSSGRSTLSHEWTRLRDALPAGGVSGQASFSDGGIGGSGGSAAVYLFRRTAALADCVLAEHYLMCQDRREPEILSLEKLLALPVAPLQQVGSNISKRLQQLELKAQAECLEYERRVWYEIDPEEAVRMQEAEREIKALTDEVESIQLQVVAETQKQKKLLNRQPRRSRD